MSQPPDPTRTPYDSLGGEPVVRAIVERFYDLMGSRADAATIRAMHPPDLRMARAKLFWFLSGWLGGPPLYVERYGHPRLRARHLPFPIGDEAAAAWMACMTQALAEHVPDEALRASLLDSLTRTALHMRNLAGPGAPMPIGPGITSVRRRQADD